MQFLISISDERKLAALTAARHQFNKAAQDDFASSSPGAAGSPDQPKKFERDQDYLAFLVERTVDFFAREHAIKAE